MIARQQYRTCRKLGESTVADFDRRVASLPADLTAPFNQEAARLESELLMIYKMVALHARAEADLDKVAAAWAGMVQNAAMSSPRAF